MFRDSQHDKLFDFLSHYSMKYHPSLIHRYKTNILQENKLLVQFIFLPLYEKRVRKGQLQSAQLLKQEARPVLAPTNALHIIKQYPNPIFGTSFIPCDIIYSSVHRTFRIAGRPGLRAFFAGAGETSDSQTQHAMTLYHKKGY